MITVSACIVLLDTQSDDLSGVGELSSYTRYLLGRDLQIYVWSNLGEDETLYSS